MTVGPEHERIKTMVGRLLETYALECGVDLNGYGNTTFRDRLAERGLEPDECYVIGTPLIEVPDLAIEVALTSGGIDKLKVYAGLRVREVWLWRQEGLEVWHLTTGRASGAAYERHARSVLLPPIDLELLSRFVGWPNQTAAVRAYREALSQAPPAR
jgi:Uma2 family endonuclease